MAKNTALVVSCGAEVDVALCQRAGLRQTRRHMNTPTYSCLRRDWPRLLAASVLSFSAATAARPQGAPASPADQPVVLEKFVVTGSLIPIAADTPAIPIAI